jgi:hypothetical protein
MKLKEKIEEKTTRVIYIYIKTLHPQHQMNNFSCHHKSKKKNPTQLLH